MLLREEMLQNLTTGNMWDQSRTSHHRGMRNYTLHAHLHLVVAMILMGNFPSLGNITVTSMSLNGSRFPAHQQLPTHLQTRWLKKWNISWNEILFQTKVITCKVWEYGLSIRVVTVALCDYDIPPEHPKHSEMIYIPKYERLNANSRLGSCVALWVRMLHS